jgi:hypothetical protein
LGGKTSELPGSVVPFQQILVSQTKIKLFTLGCQDSKLDKQCSFLMPHPSANVKPRIVNMFQGLGTQVNPSVGTENNFILHAVP